MINIDIYYLDLIGAAMGIITGIGGGLIRDALTAKVPSVFADPVMLYLDDLKDRHFFCIHRF